jgi:hypothetical protein
MKHRSIATIINAHVECLTRSLPLPVLTTSSWIRLPARFFQEPGIKGSGQQVEDMHFLSLASQVCQDYRCVFGELPNNLPAGTTGRRQCFGIGDDNQIGKVSFAFRQRLPDRYSLSAHGQSITRALDITAGEDLPRFGL